LISSKLSTPKTVDNIEKRHFTAHKAYQKYQAVSTKTQVINSLVHKAGKTVDNRNIENPYPAQQFYHRG